MKIMFTTLFILLSISVCFGQTELPACSASDIIIHNDIGRYTFKYLPEHRLSQWVAYKLTASDLNGPAQRSNNFSSDSLVKALGLPYSTTSHYKNSGFDRGHLVASADRTRSQAENRATFKMTNVAPQTPALNRGIWKSLEEQIRRWAINFDTLYIVCGPIIDSSTQKVASVVTVPQRFFKAILFLRGQRTHYLGYIMPNDTLIDNNISHYVVPLDSLERAASIDLIWNNSDK